MKYGILLGYSPLCRAEQNSADVVLVKFVPVVVEMASDKIVS